MTKYQAIETAKNEYELASAILKLVNGEPFAAPKNLRSQEKLENAIDATLTRIAVNKDTSAVQLHDLVLAAVQLVKKQRNLSDETGLMAWIALQHASPRDRKLEFYLPDNDAVFTAAFASRVRVSKELRDCVEHTMRKQNILPSTINDKWIVFLEHLLSQKNFDNPIHRILDRDDTYAKQFASEYPLLAHKLSVVARCNTTPINQSVHDLSHVGSTALKSVLQREAELPYGMWSSFDGSCGKLVMLFSDKPIFEAIRAITPAYAQHFTDIELFMVAVAEGQAPQGRTSAIHLIQRLTEAERNSVYQYLRERAFGVSCADMILDDLESGYDIHAFLAKLWLDHASPAEIAALAHNTETLRILLKHIDRERISDVLGSLSPTAQRKAVDFLVAPNV